MPFWSRSILAGVLAVLLGSPGAAHEFWIEPNEFKVRPAAQILADLKVGQNFKGSSHPYLSNSFVLFSLIEGTNIRAIKGDEGDSPAAKILSGGRGLKIISYLAAPHRLTFDHWDQFISYLKEEGLDAIALAHRERGLPEFGFTEHYIRCAKALVQAGEAAPGDRDVATGLPLELIAQINPYDEAAPVELPVLVLWQGQPMPGIQIRTFQDNGAVTQTTTRTDANGRAVISLRGGGKFLLNAVHMQEPPQGSAAAWDSYWASLTFEYKRR